MAHPPHGKQWLLNFIFMPISCAWIGAAPIQELRTWSIGMTVPSESYFVNYFKFQSQHFFKFVSILNDKPELKGAKALDIFSQFIGCEDFNTATKELKRQENQSNNKSGIEINIDRALVVKNLPKISIDESQVDTLIDHFYRQNRSWYHDKKNRDVLISSFRKAECLSFIPYQKNSNFSDDLGVDLFKLGELESEQRWNVIFRNQLVGLLKLLEVAFENKLINYYDFQDLVDMLEPESYKTVIRMFELLVKHYDLSNIDKSDLDLINDCFAKVMKFAKNGDLVDSHQRYMSLFAKVSRRRIEADRNRPNLVDGMILKSMETLTGTRLTLSEKSYQKLVDLKLICEPFSRTHITEGMTVVEDLNIDPDAMNQAFSWKEKITLTGYNFMQSRFN